MDRLVRQLWFQILLALVVGAFAGWGGFHLGYRYEYREMMRTGGHDGLAGLDVFAGGLVGCTAGFFGSFLMVLGLLRQLKRPLKE